MSRSGQDSFIDLIDLPQLRLSDDPYVLPETDEAHARLVQASIERGLDVGIITPTLQSGCLDYHALAALFQDMSVLTPVFIVTPNTAVRDRYEQLRNGMLYSKAKWPLATVKADGTLSYRTKHVRDSEAPPGVIFTRYSTRLPEEDISSEIRAVFYDDAVKFEPERWDAFCEWREEVDIPATVYFVRDPQGPVHQRIKDEVDVMWAWTPTGLKNITGSELGITEANDEIAPLVRDRQLVQQKIGGQQYQVHACTEGDVVEAFRRLWEAFEELEDAAEDIDEKQLYAAVGVAKRAVNGFSRLIPSLEYSDNYRAEHGRATTLSGRIGQVEQIMNSLRDDAAAGRTPVEHVHHALCELRDTLVDDNEKQWKHGAVLTAMQKVVDQDEELIVVLPDDPSRQALRADLRIKHTDFYSVARDHVSLHTPRSLPNADPADYLLLYGPPKYDHRWLLRTPHASHIGILAYEHELGLLYAQVSELNQSIREATPTPDKDENEILQKLSMPSLFEDPNAWQSSPSDPTKSGAFDGINITIPDLDGSDETESPFSDYSVVQSSEEDEDIDRIINSAVPDFTAGDAAYSPTESGEDRSRESGKQREKVVEGCVELCVRGGKSMVLRPTEKVRVVNQETRNTVKKPANAVRSGEQVVLVHDRDAIRGAVEKLLLDSGHIDLVGYARLWKHQLHAEIDRRDDSLDDFIERLEAEGLNKRRSTYRAWYNGEIRLPKAKKSLHAMAQAYGMDEVIEEFENVWDANHKIWNITDDYTELLIQRCQDALASDIDADPVIDEELDIRLSDLDMADEGGEPFVQAYVVSKVRDAGSVPRGQIGRLRTTS